MNDDMQPPKKLDSALTVVIEGGFLDALNSYRRASYEFMTTAHPHGSEKYEDLAQTLETRSIGVATWLSNQIKTQLGEE
ncbi:hypothetical protein ACTACN_00790 [Pseudomonas syringae]|uniref:hypothetical protein n=1 Tax=Pseudomonas syringae TaxID=317 RepID=UPI003F86A53D